MKTVVFPILLCVSACARDTLTTNVVGDIATRISNRTHSNGKPWLHIETSYRGKKEVLQIINRPDAQGKLNARSRAYYADGKLALVEGDNDSRGVFREISVNRPDTEDFEIFNLQPDGTLKPIGAKEIELIKKEEAVVDESINKMFQKSAQTDWDAGKALEETRRKIRALQRQENDVAATNVAHDITNSVSEHAGLDGKPDFRVETCYRGKSKILETVSCRDKQGKLTVWSRTYSINGKSIATENDDDGDGFFEHLAVYPASNDDAEMFNRYKDGTVTLATKEEVELRKNAGDAALNHLLKMLQNQEIYDRDSGKVLEESRLKLQGLQTTNAIH